VEGEIAARGGTTRHSMWELAALWSYNERWAEGGCILARHLSRGRDRAELKEKDRSSAPYQQCRGRHM
jgi:hypothetical protein